MPGQQLHLLGRVLGRNGLDQRRRLAAGKRAQLGQGADRPGVTRIAADDQQPQQHSERIDVRGRGDLAAFELFR